MVGSRRGDWQGGVGGGRGGGRGRRGGRGGRGGGGAGGWGRGRGDGKFGSKSRKGKKVCRSGGIRPQQRQRRFVQARRPPLRPAGSLARVFLGGVKGSSNTPLDRRIRTPKYGTPNFRKLPCTRTIEGSDYHGETITPASGQGSQH